jgi:ferredoxin
VEVSLGTAAAQQVLDRSGLDALLSALADDGYDVIGPAVRDQAVSFVPVRATADLPVGLEDEQSGGRYRLKERDDDALFAHTVGPSSPRRFLQRPRERLFSTRRQGKRLKVIPDAPVPSPVALLGVRGCDLAAVAIQDRVLMEGEHPDAHYSAAREGLFIIATHCTRSGNTCFCASTGHGPRADAGYDLALTELVGDGEHRFVVEVGSDRGAAVLARVETRAASDEEMADADARVSAAAEAQTTALPEGTREALQKTLDSDRYDEVAKRCLACSNCTMVCPTCFCTTVEDVPDLSGDEVERWRHWDSCFTSQHSYIHGGAIRGGTKERYRQWLTHKLSTWQDQFDTPGCTGCGRCITWCPVGIDLTQEARALAEEARAQEA